MSTDRTACRNVMSSLVMEDGHTLNSVNAKFLPKQILGPSENESRCLCTFGFSWKNRSGLNSFESGPQDLSLRLVKMSGADKIVPLVTTRESITCPDAVSIGMPNGMTSSPAA